MSDHASGPSGPPPPFSRPALPEPPKPFPDPIPGLIPFGTVSMFVGATGAGKTTMAVAWLNAWLNDGTICGYPTNKPTEVVWITADRPGAETLGWFTRQGVDLKSFKRYSILDDPRFPFAKLKTVGTVGEAFEYCLDQVRPAPGSLVIFDPLTPLFIMGDGNKARDVALTLITYTKLCLDRQITLIAMGHFGKQKGAKDDRYARPQDRIAGSNAFGGFTSTQIYLIDPEPEDAQVWTLGWVPRQDAPTKMNFVRDSQGFFVQVSDESAHALETVETARAGRKLLLELLPANVQEIVTFSVVAHQMMSALNIAKSTTFKYRKRLEFEGLVEIVGRGQIRLTEAGALALASWQLVEDVPGAAVPS